MLKTCRGGGAEIFKRADIANVEHSVHKKGESVMVNKVNNNNGHVKGAYEQRQKQNRPVSKTEQAKIDAIFKNLDKADGKEDGFISANIWNKYADEHGGKPIKSRIGVKNAKASIEIYRERALDRYVGDKDSSVNKVTANNKKTAQKGAEGHYYHTGNQGLINDLLDIHKKLRGQVDPNRTKTVNHSKENQTNTYYDKKGKFLYAKTENFKTKEVKIILDKEGTVGMIGKYNPKTKKIYCHTYFMKDTYVER